VPGVVTGAVFGIGVTGAGAGAVFGTGDNITVDASGTGVIRTGAVFGNGITDTDPAKAIEDYSNEQDGDHQSFHMVPPQCSLQD